MKCQSLLSGGKKIRKISNLLSVKFAQRLGKVKEALA